MADQYFLRWNNHQPNFITVFKDLLKSEELVDVTLSVEGKHIKAHKVILSACSPYFKLLFTSTPCKHPVIILSDMKYTDLRIIIDFIYCGEVNVGDDQLADILDVAEALQVRGLYDPKNSTGNLSSNSKNRPPIKRRKRNSDMDAISYLQGNEILEQQLVTPSLSELVTNDLKDEPNWLPAEYQNNESTGFQTNNSSQEFEGISGDGEQEKSKDLFNQSLEEHGSQNIVKPGRGRRRGSIKVQESQNFLLALEAVRSGSLGFCKAAKLYGLNNRTLWLEYKKRGYPSYRPPVAGRHKAKAESVKPL